TIFLPRCLASSGSPKTCLPSCECARGILCRSFPVGDFGVPRSARDGFRNDANDGGLISDACQDAAKRLCHNMTGALGRPIACNQAKGGKLSDLTEELAAVDDSGRAVFVPGDSLARLVMGAARENGLRALAAAADAQLTQHFARVGMT